jgi:3-hydroxyisobutyrate dehydrogenase
MGAIESLGVIGVGTMGEPICVNLARKCRLPVYAVDRRPEPLRRVAADGVAPCASLAELASRTDLVFLSLPSGREVEALCLGAGGIAAIRGRIRLVVDCGTSPVALTRRIAARLAAVGIDFADAPVARTREAAQQGRLSIMVGASPELFERVSPYLLAFGTDITHCGPVGSGQAVKILNNMVLFETVNALAEAVAVARRNGIDPKLLLDTLSKGSADSFALRNHGMKAIVPNVFPERAFSTEYALKDLSYALELAGDAGIKIRGAELVGKILQEAIDAGSGEAYFPVIAKHIGGG